MMLAEDKDSRAPGQALSAVWQRKRFILTTVLAVLAISVLLLSLVTPRYTAEAVVALNTRANSTDQVLSAKPTTLTPPLSTVLVRTEMDILRSRALAAQVVDQMGLEKDPEFNEDLRRIKGFPGRVLAAVQPVVTQAGDWVLQRLEPLAEAVGLTLPKPSDPTATARARTIDAAMKRLTVKTDAESYAIRVQFEAEGAEKAAQLANAFAETYIANQVRGRYADIDAATGWINKQIAGLRAEVDDANADINAYRERFNLSPFDAEPGTLPAQRLLAFNNELVLIERERSEAERKLQQAESALARGGDWRGLDFAESPFIQELRRQEAQLLGRVAALSVRYNDHNPALERLHTQIADIRKQIREEIAKQVQSLKSRVEQARGRERDMQARINEYTQGASVANRSMTQLQQRQTDVKAKNMTLETFLARYQEIANRVEIEEPDARIVSHAEAPAQPSYPRSILFLGIAFIGSLGLSSSIVFLLDRFRSGFLTTHQVRDELALPTLGIIPELRRLPKRTTPSEYLLANPTSRYAEAVKSAQLAILNARPGPRSNGILITSSLPGEGKTGFAAALARSLAHNGHQTLLVDCDFRRPALARLLGVKSSPGLSDYLEGQCTLDEVVRTDEATGLRFIPAGSHVGDPQQLLNSAEAAAALTAFLDQYELVLVDSPPTMVASDAAVLAKICDVALYVVEWDKTPRRAVQAGVEYLRSFGVHVAGVVLSKVDLEKQRTYGDYVDFCFRNDEYYRNG